MTGSSLGSARAAGQRILIGVLLTLGTLASVGGVLGAVIAKWAVDQSQLAGAAYATLRAGAYTGYFFPHHPVANYTGAWIGAVVAVIGVIALAAGVTLLTVDARGSKGAVFPRPRAVTLMLAAGTLTIVIGVVGALRAKWAADIASYLASQPRAEISDPNDPLALGFDPASAHYLAPDYTMFVIFLTVAVIGVAVVVMVVVAGMLRSVRPRRNDQRSPSTSEP